jgi:hypothetical protein
VTTYQAQLLPLLDQYFDEEELRSLCFDLGVQYDNLGGRGKAAHARELIARLEREQRLAELIAAVRRQRPAVNWPDPPPPPDLTTAHARQDQAQAIFTQARRLIAPHVRSPVGRDALFSEAYYPAHEWVLDQIDFADAAAVFLPRCWQTLRDLAPDGSLHTRLLLALRPRYGHGDQRQIDSLIIAWQQFCVAQQASRSAVPAPVSERQPVLETAGQPALFLSYADRDTAVARGLAAALSKYGHACRLERAPKTDNNAWLAATAAGLGSAYAVLLLVGEQTADDRWQRLEYLAAADRQKVIIPVRLGRSAVMPAHVQATPLNLPLDDHDGAGFEALLQRLPPPPPPARHTWLSEADILRPRLAELAYMDRLKLAELQYVAQYTRLSGQAEIRRSSSGRLQLNPVVARQEFHHLPWRQDVEMAVERRRFEDAVAELKDIGRAVLLGDPGSGKTTTLYKLAADLIEAALADPAKPIPLMVSLGLWTDAADSFADFLRRSVGELGDHLSALLGDGRASLLLDGINEIPANQQAAKYRQVGSFLAQHPDLPAWVSCREQDYPPERDLRLDRVTVAPLDAVRVWEFAHNYLDDLPEFGREAADDLFWQLAGEAAQATFARFEKEMEEKLPAAAGRFAAFWLADGLPEGVTWGWGKNNNRYWESWLKQRAHPASLLLLATNPYMLFMLLDVYEEYQTLPANRGQLFDRFVEMLLVRERLLELEREAETRTIISRPEGKALLMALTKLAFDLQTQRTGQKGDQVAQTALPLVKASRYLTPAQQYQAVSANLLSINDDVRFAHQLLQEYFAARAMRERIFPVERLLRPDSVQVSKSFPLGRDLENRATKPLQAADIWPPDRWWQPTNWEEATILLAGLYSNDCTPVLDWLADAQPELAARCVVESGAHPPPETKLRLRDLWLPRLTDLKRDPDARARAAVGRALGRVTLEDGSPLDNRPGVGFVLRDGLKIPDIVWGEAVPAGEYEIGGDKEAYQSLDKQSVPIAHAYRLARYPITNSQFNCFATAPDIGDERWWRGLPDKERQISEPYFPYANSPRERVSWYQAVAFCRWLSDKLGYKVELPHEHEWEVAARWPDGRYYPWGNEFDSDKANTSARDNVGQPTAVGLYPHGANQELKLYDLSGNVWEWCRNKYEKRDDDQVDNSNERRVLRGGAGNNDRARARAASRFNFTPDYRVNYFGFRVVVRRPPSHLDH